MTAHGPHVVSFMTKMPKTLSHSHKTEALQDTPRRIFIADEDPLICELIRYNLEADGFTVSVFNNADDALDADFTLYDLFLIDITMDGLSGIKVAQYLKQNKMTSRTPLIFCASCSDEEAVIDGLDYGADDYILKPFSMKELKSRINKLLHRNIYSKA